MLKVLFVTCTFIFLLVFAGAVRLNYPNTMLIFWSLRKLKTRGMKIIFQRIFTAVISLWIGAILIQFSSINERGMNG